MGKLIKAMNGGVCGYGYLGTFEPPKDFAPDFECMFTYSSEDCTETCLALEGWYWVMKSYHGMCYYYGAGDTTADNQFTLCTPDEGMEPIKDARMGTLEERAPEIYDVLKN